MAVGAFLLTGASLLEFAASRGLQWGAEILKAIRRRDVRVCDKGAQKTKPTFPPFLEKVHEDYVGKADSVCSISKAIREKEPGVPRQGLLQVPPGLNKTAHR